MIKDVSDRRGDLKDEEEKRRPRLVLFAIISVFVFFSVL